MAQAQVTWTDVALADLEGIRAYLARFNPRAAHRIAIDLIEAAENLAEHPRIGRSVGPGRRELVTIYPYVIQYRVEEGEVVIAHIRHGRQRPNRNF